MLIGLNPNVSPGAGKGPAIKRPTGYTRIWIGAIWLPNAPDGYVSLGDVINNEYDNGPPNDSIWCIRSDLAQVGNYAMP